MKIEVLQEQLMGGLQVVLRAVSSRTQLPVLAYILIEAKPDGLTLSATDLEIGMRVKVAAKVLEVGEAVVPAKMIAEFLGSLNPGKVTMKSEGQSVVLSSPGYSAKFQTMEVSEFPRIPEVGKEGIICALKMSELTAAIEGVVFASAKDSLRPVLTGTLLELGEKKIKLVATDGFRLAIQGLETKVEKEMPPLLVPSRVLMELTRFEGEEQVKIGHLAATNQIYFLVGEQQVVSQLLSGNFPDYQKILPKEFLSEAVVNKDELLQAIRAAHIFARDNSNMVRWGGEGAKLTLTSTSPEKGECKIEIPATLTGEPSEVVFNAKYILDYLGMVAGDQLWVGTGSKLAPAMFREGDKKTGQYVVMPINA